MTSRSKSGARGFETEIEKSREEANWKKAIELALQLKQRSPQHESLAQFLIGEGKLEAYLESARLGGAPAAAAASEPRELNEARGFLAAATDDAGKRAGVALDAHLLLGKLHYAAGDPAAALSHFARAELDTLTEKELPVRSLRIVAESFAIKGLCLEATATSATASGTSGGGGGGGSGGGSGGGGSRYKQAERSGELLRSYELAGDLTLLYAQRTGASAGPLLDAALLRAPALLARWGRAALALRRLRGMLAAVESAHSAPLRLPLARQLAELLLRAQRGPTYEPPPQDPDPPPASPWAPKRYSAINQFVPRTEHEEALLALLVAEALAVRDAVLSQSHEFAAARDLSLHNAISIADLIALVAARWGQLCLVLESLERAMKFSFGNAHVWRQRALATAAAVPAASPEPDAEPVPPPQPGSAAWACNVRAAGVLARALALSPRDVALSLVAATTAYNMGWYEEGIVVAERAVAAAEETDAEPQLLARACLVAATGHQARAQKSNCRLEKEAALSSSLALLLRAARVDDNDHMTFYRLALQYTRAGRLNDAMDACRACLQSRADCPGGLRLAAALWSCACAGRRAARALRAARLACEHYPRAAWPRAQLAQLQLRRESGDKALNTARTLLHQGGPDPPEPAPTEPAELDAASSVGPSVSSVAGGAGRAAAWLTLAELCCALGRAAAARGCVAEAAAAGGTGGRLLRVQGMIAASTGDWQAARRAAQDALALRPTDVDALVQLGAALYNLGWLRLAEKTLRDAAALEPRRADTWRRLALVLAAAGEHHAAADCAAAAIALQPLEPALPLPA